MTQACKPGSVLTAIYLAPGLLLGSSRLLGTIGPITCPSTALLRDRVYIVKPMLPWAGCALTAPFHPCCTASEDTRSGISLLHLSWGHPRRALPVIPALWSPDFPHPPPFGVSPRLSGLVAGILYSMEGKLSNVLQILFRRDILIFRIVNDRLQFVGGGIPDAPFDGTACKWGVKDAAPYAQFYNSFLC